MPELLNSLDIDSYTEKCFFLFVFQILIFSPIRNNSIISVFAIQYTWIYTTYIYFLDTFPSSVFLMQFGILERSILFFRLSFNLSEGMFHYDRNWAFPFLLFVFFLFLSFFLRTDRLYIT